MYSRPALFLYEFCKTQSLMRELCTQLDLRSRGSQQSDNGNIEHQESPIEKIQQLECFFGLVKFGLMNIDTQLDILFNEIVEGRQLLLDISSQR